MQPSKKKKNKKKRQLWELMIGRIYFIKFMDSHCYMFEKKTTTKDSYPKEKVLHQQLKSGNFDPNYVFILPWKDCGSMLLNIKVFEKSPFCPKRKKIQK